MTPGRLPRWTRRLLELVLPAEDRDFVLGDLEEEYERRLRSRGRWAAGLWFRLEASRSVWPLLTYRGRWRGVVMTGLAQDLRGALRIFHRTPGFAAVVVLTVAIGVGGATAVYSVLRGVVLTPLRFEDSERVVMLWGRSAEYPRAPLTVGDYNELSREVDAFEEVAASWSNTALLIGELDAEQVSVGWVTPEYFDLLRVGARLGRIFEADEVAAVLLSHDLWVRRFGADPAVVGRSVALGSESMEVVGILPADVDPNLTTFSATKADHDVWRLQPPDWTRGDDRSVGWLRASARLGSGVSLEQARTEVGALMRRVNQTVSDRDGGTDLTVDVVPVRADLVADVSHTLWILLAAVTGVLLVAASNVAHLMLGRSETRGGEVAVRAALGGSRFRLVRQLLVESVTLAAAGGALGLIAAWWGVHALLSVAPSSLPRLDQVRLDASVLGFAMAATATAAIVFGVVPALSSGRADLARALRDRRTTGGRGHQRMSRGLVVVQVALSLVLLTGTGLLLRSLYGLGRVDAGFAPEGVVTFAIEADSWGANNEEAAARIVAYQERIRSVPGVIEAGFTNRIPLGGGLFTGSYRSEEMVAAEVEAREGSVRWISPGYLEALGARVVAGRGFLPEDGVDRVLLDETSAGRLWPGQPPLGRRVELGGINAEPVIAEVIGIVAPMKHGGLADPAPETVFRPMLALAAQQNFRYVAARVAGEPDDFVQPLREAVRSVHSASVLARVRTLDELVAQDTAATRFASLLLLVFGAVALGLATIGLHGVMAFAVRRRARELGIRMALGADREALLRSALGSGAVLVAAGVALGLLLSGLLSRTIASLLYGVAPADPAALALAVSVISVVGLLGAYLPARIVLGVDPAVTLREE